MKRVLGLVSLCIVSTASISPVFAQPPAGVPQRAITEIRDGLYKVTTGPRVSPVLVFLVTSDGIVVVDPPTPEVATWLKGELASRFPGREVKYVVESHYHWDHVRGAGMFADTARFIGHENMRKNLMLPLAFAPPPGNTRDHDGDNRLSRDEALTGTRANFDRFNGDGDDYLTAAEINADVRRPDIVFDDRYTVTLGEQRVELIWARNRHTDDLIDVYFPDHRVLFAGDYIWINRMCCNFGFDERPMSTWIDSITALEALDFDILINSHFESGTKADLVAFRQWLEALSAAVSAGIDDGLSLEQMQESIRLDEYRDWAGYGEQLPGIIESAYLSLTRYSR